MVDQENSLEHTVAESPNDNLRPSQPKVQRVVVVEEVKETVVAAV